MALDNKYSLEMIWSNEDGAFLATVRELPGCMADGSTPEEALKNLKVIAQEWIETAKEEGRKIPEPFTLEFMLKSEAVARHAFEQEFEKRIREAVGQIFQKFSEQQATPSVASWRERGFVGFEDPKFVKSR
jgi:predicted RNase H-like HicB family nuclease